MAPLCGTGTVGDVCQSTALGDLIPVSWGDEKSAVWLNLGEIAVSKLSLLLPCCCLEENTEDKVT